MLSSSMRISTCEDDDGDCQIWLSREKRQTDNISVIIRVASIIANLVSESEKKSETKRRTEMKNST